MIYINFNQEEINQLKYLNYKGQPSQLNEHAQTIENYFQEHPPLTVAQAQAKIEELTYRYQVQPHTKLYTHLVFITKYRNKILSADHLEALETIFNDAGRKMTIKCKYIGRYLFVKFFIKDYASVNIEDRTLAK